MDWESRGRYGSGLSTIIPCDPLEKYLFSVPVTSGFAGLRSIRLILGITAMAPLNRKWRVPSSFEQKDFASSLGDRISELDL